MPRLTVFYDGACPRCVRDRKRYEMLAGHTDLQVQWLDITGRDQELQQIGIDPHAALTELHVQDSDGHILRELDAYIALMRHVPLLRPVAWLIALPLIRPALARICHGPECSQCGGPELLQQLTEAGITAERCSCQGLCHEAPVVFTGSRCMAEADFETLILRIVSQQGHKPLPSGP